MLTGQLHVHAEDPQRLVADLPSPRVQAHAANLMVLRDGTLACVWFGGSMEGKSDICVFMSRLAPGSSQWSAPVQLSSDPDRSEQNPILFPAPNGDLWLLHTAQSAGHQDTAVVRRRISKDNGQTWGPTEDVSDAPAGTFVRQPIQVQADGSWLLGIFRCVPVPGMAWDGSLDDSAVLRSTDQGQSWQRIDVPNSLGCVHMNIVPGKDEKTLLAFFRSRWADHVYRTRSLDGGLSWEAPQPTVLPNNNSSIQAIRLQDGRLAMIFNASSALDATGRRESLYDELDDGEAAPNPVAGEAPKRRAFWGAPRAPLTLALSADDGLTWPWQRHLETGDGYCMSNNSEQRLNREYSYPSIRQSADGALHLAYTVFRQHIRHARVMPDWVTEKTTNPLPVGASPAGDLNLWSASHRLQGKRLQRHDMSATPYLLLNPGRVHAGAGSLAQLTELAAYFKARRVLIVTTQSVAKLVAPARQSLEAAGLAVTVIANTPPEPEVADVQAIEAAARAAGRHDLVVGIGGGSAIDVAKILAVLLAHDLDLRDVLTKKVEITARGLPNIMVPTTSGTGAEATPNSIILVPEDELKIGIVSPRLLPDAVILDPLLTLSLPPEVTASTGMDALTHAIECYCSKKGNAFSELYALEAIRLIGRSIRRAFHNGQDVAAREDMLMGAYWGGVCIATSSTTAVHALAYPLGGKYRMAHGLSNAILLPSVMAFNQQGNEQRFAAMARAMGLQVDDLSDAAAADAFVQALRQLNTDLNIPNSLQGFGIAAGDLDGLVEGASKVTRLLDNNPRPMGKGDMRAIYAALL